MSLTPVVGIKARIVDAAQEVVQHHGYGGLSYHQISDRYGIGIESIESCFPRKAELGAAVAAQYRNSFMTALDAARHRTPGTFELLETYADFFRKALVDEDRMCLCGMLGAEIGTLPGEVSTEVGRFFEVNLEWLRGLLERGAARGELCLESAAETEASLILATLEGAMLVARSTGRHDTFDESIYTFLGRYRLRC